MDAMTSPESPSPRRLRRASADRRVAGVAGGLADHFGLDPTLVRIGFVVLAFLGGIGLAVYAVAAFVMPAEPDGPPLTGTAKVALAIIAVSALFSFPFAGGSALVLAVPAALGVLVWRLFGGRADPRLVRAAIVVVAIAGSVVVGVGAGVAAAFGGGTVIAVLVIAAGVVLVAGGLRGGMRWLILPAMMLAIPATVVEAADLKLEGGVGEREYRPASVSELRPVYRLGAGDLHLDLRDLRLEDGQTVDVTARVGAGLAEVTVPGGVCVQASGDTGVGAIDLLGRVNEGVDVDAETGGVPAAGQAVLRVTLKGGVGELQVDRTPSDGEYGPRLGTGCEG